MKSNIASNCRLDLNDQSTALGWLTGACSLTMGDEAMLAAALLTLLAQSPVAAAQPAPARFGWFGDLAGSCWQGLHPGGQRLDRQCYSTQYGRFMRGTIALTRPNSPDAPAHHGDSVFAADPEGRHIIFYFWGSDGQHGASEGEYEGELLVFADPPTSGGQAPGRRTVWRRLDADHFRVSVQTRDGEAWTERFAVTYERNGAAD